MKRYGHGNHPLAVIFSITKNDDSMFHIAKGVDIVTVSSLAGHENASTTLNMYSHAVQERKASAVEAVGDLLSGVV